MDLGSSLLYLVCFVVLGAHGPAHGSTVDQMSCLCLEIPTRPFTEPQPGTCFQKGSRFRYKCVQGYLRKVGTSDLTICKETDGFSHGSWSIPSLVCIPDPRITTKQPPVLVATEKKFSVNLTTQQSAATSTRLQMTQSSVPSTTVTAENSADLTSLMSDQSHATENAEDNKTPTLTTASSSDNSTANPPLLLKQGSGTAAWVTCAALAIVSAAIGISFWCYKRRSKTNNPPPTEEELTHMNQIQSGLVI